MDAYLFCSPSISTNSLSGTPGRRSGASSREHTVRYNAYDGKRRSSKASRCEQQKPRTEKIRRTTSRAQRMEKIEKNRKHRACPMLAAYFKSTTRTGEREQKVRFPLLVVSGEFVKTIFVATFPPCFPPNLANDGQIFQTQNPSRGFGCNGF